VNPSPDFAMADILRATGGVLLRGGHVQSFHGITTDSRAVSPGNLFIALHGEKFDGHAYLDQAVENGAKGLLVHRDDGKERGNVPAILVDDTLKALGDLAHAWRKRFNLPILAITGSSGKTTTKEMAASILAQSKKILKTQGNYNNLIGLPLTLFRLEEEHEAAILELGTNRPGEIARLTRIAEPAVAVVTNVGPAHLEGFGTLAGVAREKGDIFRNMPPGGVAVLNADDPYIRQWDIDPALRRITFGFDADADVSAADIRYDGSAGIGFVLKIKGTSASVNLSVTGRHNAANALAAAALAWAAGSTIEEIRHGLETFTTVSGRMEIIPLGNGAFVINDTYNANPASVGEALKALQALRRQGQGIAVLGDMLELGHEAAARHRDIGGLLADTGVTWVYLRGRFSQATAAGALNKGMAESRIVHFEDPAQIIDLILSRVKRGDWILVKGSRGMKMEEVVERLAAAGRMEEGVPPSKEAAA